MTKIEVYNFFSYEYAVWPENLLDNIMYEHECKLMGFTESTSLTLQNDIVILMKILATVSLLITVLMHVSVFRIKNTDTQVPLKKKIAIFRGIFCLFSDLSIVGFAFPTLFYSYNDICVTNDLKVDWDLGNF